MSRRRNKELLSKKYQKEFNNHINNILNTIQHDISTSFILLARDTKRYPSSGEIIALTSQNNNDRYWKVFENNNTPQSGMRLIKIPYEEKEETRYFSDIKADFKVGVNEPRYMAVVDDIITENNNTLVSFFDDIDTCHITNDNVQVVDLYIYPASKYISTFKDGYDLDDNILAIKLSDLMNIDDIINIVEDGNEKMIYERSIIDFQTNIKQQIIKIYRSRGVVYENNVCNIRIRLERCILNSDSFEDGLTFGAKEFLINVFNKGYDIDIVTDFYAVNINDVIEFLGTNGINYSTINSFSQFMYIIDTRSLPNFGIIDWVESYKKITSEDLFPNEYKEDVEQIFNGTYLDLAHIEYDAFNMLLNSGMWDEKYKKFPKKWESVLQLKKIFNNCIGENGFIKKGFYEYLSVYGIDENFK